ncbi:MAG: hypothetical protein J5789_09295 [Oscillospiraceae bacterium]|nr:hypothetical protein [Oscillospiraceae bacterium]
MADVTLSYKGQTIGVLNSTGNLTMKTAGKYCEADIDLVYVKSGEGSPRAELTAIYPIGDYFSWFTASASAVPTAET